MPGLIIVGAGPRIGVPVARRFAKEGVAIGLIARSQATLDAGVETLAAEGASAFTATADSTDESALRAALDAVVDQLGGTPDALVYNAARLGRDSVGELDSGEQLEAWAVNVVGALTATSHVGPAMAERGSGTIILTGGRPDPATMVSMTLGKAGVRALTDVLDAAYGPAGVHAATVTICGAVAPGTPFDPDEIAGHYWNLHTQSREDWQREIVHDGN